MKPPWIPSTVVSLLQCEIYIFLAEPGIVFRGALEEGRPQMHLKRALGDAA